jgi:hypothetical protein
MKLRSSLCEIIALGETTFFALRDKPGECRARGPNPKGVELSFRAERDNVDME